MHSELAQSEIIALWAVCDLYLGRAPNSRSQSFTVAEYALLASGDLRLLRSGLGWTVEARGAAISLTFTPASLIKDVLNVVLPDYDEPEDDHPWEWLATLAQKQDLTTSAVELRGLPYRVLLTDRVLNRITE